MPKIAIIRLDDYQPEALDQGFEAAFAELGLERVFASGDRILIKPNLLAAATPEQAVTPHPEVFRALAARLQALGVRLSYGDSPATDAPDKAARTSGLADVADRLGIAAADFTQKEDVPLPAGRLLKRLPLALGVREADGLVSLAKLKTHALIGMTGAIKNLFGVIPGARKALYHSSYPDPGMFSQMLVDIAAYCRPRLSVIDGIVGMEGNGPRNGRPRKVGAIILSTDPVAADAAMAALVGVDPGTILTTRLAAAAELGSMDLGQIESALILPFGNDDGTAAILRGLACQHVESQRVPDFNTTLRWQTAMTLLAAIGTPLLKRFLLNRPVIDPARCTRCSACVTACPLDPKALCQAATEEVPAYDYTSCIRCYCCQEICPAGAIDVRRSLVGRILHT
jgi:uncharacterized protein (DUF362 family)/Pyruvate/2-oxoacid:ferredoxin oxidoreductase delta subunit